MAALTIYRAFFKDIMTFLADFMRPFFAETFDFPRIVFGDCLFILGDGYIFMTSETLPDSA
jgi:hypothetical protein